MVLAASALLTVPGWPAGAQTSTMTAAELAHRISAGQLVELTDVSVEGDVTLPRTTRVTAPVRCRRCRFSGSVRAPDTVFERGLDLEASVVGGDLDLSGALLDDWVNLDGARVDGAAMLRGATFADTLSLRQAEFGASLDFDHGRAKGAVSAARATFAGPARFTATQFAGRADFGQGRFPAGARFDDVVFEGAPTFSLAEFEGDAIFDGAELRAGGSFQFARFDDLSFVRAVASGNLAFDEAVVDGEADFDGLTSSGTASLAGMRLRSGSLFVEQMTVKDLTMDVDLVPAIRGRVAQKRMLRALETSAKERGDLSVANDARFHLLSMKGKEKQGWRAVVDDLHRVGGGYLVRPVHPIASFALLLAAASFVRLTFSAFIAIRARRAAGEEGRARLVPIARETKRFLLRVSQGAARVCKSVADSLSVAFRRRPDVPKPTPTKLRSYGTALGGWGEYLLYKILLAVIILTIGNANATVRELLESVRP